MALADIRRRLVLNSLVESGLFSLGRYRTINEVQTSYI